MQTNGFTIQPAEDTTMMWFIFTKIAPTRKMQCKLNCPRANDTFQEIIESNSVDGRIIVEGIVETVPGWPVKMFVAHARYSWCSPLAQDTFTYSYNQEEGRGTWRVSLPKSYLGCCMYYKVYAQDTLHNIMVDTG
jgi:hypothetical protein